MKTGTILIIIGLALVLIGLLWPWIARIPLGRLPGDIIIERPNLRIYIPITSMLLLSALLTFILWLIRK